MTSESLTVFATVGTDHHRFDRLVEWMDAWAEANPARASCTIQFGASAKPRSIEGFPYTGHHEMEELIAACDVIVCHGGSGSISEARRLGRRPLVVPRRPDLGEHVDDHQIAHSRRLAQAGEILLAEDQATFELRLAQALDDPRSVRISPEMVDLRETIARFANLVDPLVFAPTRRRWLSGGGRWR